MSSGPKSFFLSNSVDLLVCMALASAKQTRFSLKLKMIFHTYSKIVFKAGRKRKINAIHTVPQCRKIPKKCHLYNFGANIQTLPIGGWG